VGTRGGRDSPFVPIRYRPFGDRNLFSCRDEADGRQRVHRDESPKNPHDHLVGGEPLHQHKSSANAKQSARAEDRLQKAALA